MRILSLDGGGIRGLYTATLLSYLEHDSGKRISDLFDLLVGTSTGGILCLGLTHPTGFSAQNLVGFYKDNARTIFDAKGTGSALFSPKYDGTGLRTVLETYFGPKQTLAEAVRPVCVTAVDLATVRPKLFTSYGTPQATFVDAALATSAGPTYFPAHGNLADGGLVANNPSLVGLADAIGQGVGLADIRCISLGTGRYDPSLASLDGAGDLQWASHVSDVTIDAGAELATYIAGVLLGSRYLRIQPNLDEAMSPMDNISPLNLAKLEALAAQVWQERGAEIKTFLGV